MLLEYLQFRPEIAQIFENAHTLTDTPKLITSSIPEVINLHLTPKSITCIPEIDNRYIWNQENCIYETCNQHLRNQY